MTVASYFLDLPHSPLMTLNDWRLGVAFFPKHYACLLKLTKKKLGFLVTLKLD